MTSAWLVVVGLAAQAETYTYWIQPCQTATTNCRAGDEQLALWALEAWERAALGAVRFQRTSETEARMRVYWAAAQTGLYGEARPIWVRGKPGAELRIRTELSDLGADIARESERDPLFRDAVVYLTCLHEAGHALGLPHTASFADIMYNFQYGGDILEYFQRYRRKLRVRADIRNHTGLSPADVGALRKILPMDQRAWPRQP